jgi:hypothetical protein
MKTVEINGVAYAPVNDGEAKHQIVVLDRGFVVAGMVSIKDSYVTISDCVCVRAWGTTRGLGQLAYEGPTGSTKLDKQPTTTVHEMQVVQFIDIESGVEKWNQ